MAAHQQQPGPAPSPALLQAVLRRDLPAVEALLQPSAGASLTFEGLGALHAVALADWGAVVPLLVAAGAPLDESVTFTLDKAEEKLAPLGLTPEQLAALQPIPGYFERKSRPLFLAVQQGAFDAAAALLAAGAELAPEPSSIWEVANPHKSAWGALTLLAAAKAAAAASPAAASQSVPPLVQRLAALLLEACPLAGPSMTAAHAAAAELAFPSRLWRHAEPRASGGWYSAPACPWLLERLLQLHTAGEVAATDEAAEAVYVLLARLFEVAPSFAGGAGGAGPREAAALQWLRLPAAQRLSAARAIILGGAACARGMTSTALPALLQMERVRSALREDAQRPPSAHAAPAHTLVVAAAATGQPAVLDAVLAAGGAVTLHTVKAVVRDAWTYAAAERSLGVLRLLLSRQVPPVPVEVPTTGAARHASPIFVLLDAFVAGQERVCESIQTDALESGERPTDKPLQELHLQFLRLMDALAEAGYRPATFSNVRQDYDGDGALPTYYPPAELGKEWELSDSAKWLWRAAERKPWSPATHAAFPPAFREAARALLLAAHRAHGRDGATTLGVLPPALQLSILGQAAYPLSAWSPCMEDCSALRLVQRRAEEHDRRVARAKARRKQKGKGTPSA